MSSNSIYPQGPHTTTGVDTTATTDYATVVAGALGGDVVGPAVAEDNVLARFDGTTGKLIQSVTTLMNGAGTMSDDGIIKANSLRLLDGSGGGPLSTRILNGGTLTATDKNLTIVPPDANFTLTLTGTAASLTGTNTGDQTDITGNAGTVTVADSGADTTMFPLLATDATGSLSPRTDAQLTFNASTDVMTMGGLITTGTAKSQLTKWRDFNIQGRIGFNEGWTLATDGLQCSVDGVRIWVSLNFAAGTILSKLRVKYVGSNASTGVKVTLRKRDESSTTTTKTTVGAQQTMVSASVVVTEYDFADETMAVDTSYELIFESEVPAAQTVTLYAFGVETTERAL